MKMRRSVSRWMLTYILIVGTMVLTGCSPNADDYKKKPYNVTDEERVKYAEGLLGTTIDPEQDWVLTSEYSVSITADAHLGTISKVIVLDSNPYAGVSSVMASAAATNNAKVALTFRAPKDSLMYAACVSTDGKCIARPFLPGKEQQVSFVVAPGSYSDSQAAPRRADRIDIDYPTYKQFSIKDFINFRKALYENLPDGQTAKTPFFGNSAYIRLHGRNADAWYSDNNRNNGSARYCYDYSEQELASFVPIIQNAAVEIKKVHVFFNNHPDGNGAKNAKKLKEML